MKNLLEALKKGYDPQGLTDHVHKYDKKSIQSIFEPVFSSERDKEYHDNNPDRWQGEVKKVGEKITYLCSVCDRSEEMVSRLIKLWESF